MNAREKGHACGSARKAMYTRISKEQWEKVGRHDAKHVYASEQKQTEFLAGWMENWREMHEPECRCQQCEAFRAEILTY